jgi:hypothetical protein
MKISTVNIIEQHDGEIIGLSSFANNKDGNIEADILFYDLIADDNPNLLGNEIENCVKKGYYQLGAYVIKSVISTNS